MQDTYKQELRFLARKYKVRLYFCYKYNHFSGIANGATNSITINGNIEKRNEILSTFFHELGHIYCYDNNLWNSYHKECYSKNTRRTALKAERWVDKWAEKELYKYNNKIKFIPSYQTKKSIQFLKRVLNEKDFI